MTTTPLLQIRDLVKYFPIDGGKRQVRAVDGVSFDLMAGECLALVGESGCGKTTVGRTLLRAYNPTSGSAIYRREDDSTVDLMRLSARELRPLRRYMQMIFQNPYSSLNPRMTVADIIGEPLLVNGVPHAERLARVRELMHEVGLPESYLMRYPHAFSGGQRQRIGIARALALHPRLIVADEPVSALDVSVQAQVLNLLGELQRRLGLTYLFVAHDLSVVRHLADRVAVMYVGKIVEIAGVDELFDTPRHPYTEALLSAVPVPDPTRPPRRLLQGGDIADPSDPPPGCAFHPRCRYAQPRCSAEIPALRELSPGHSARCHFAEELELGQ